MHFLLLFFTLVLFHHDKHNIEWTGARSSNQLRKVRVMTNVKC